MYCHSQRSGQVEQPRPRPGDELLVGQYDGPRLPGSQQWHQHLAYGGVSRSRSRSRPSALGVGARRRRSASALGVGPGIAEGRARFEAGSHGTAGEIATSAGEIATSAIEIATSAIEIATSAGEIDVPGASTQGRGVDPAPFRGPTPSLRPDSESEGRVQFRWPCAFAWRRVSSVWVKLSWSAARFASCVNRSTERAAHAWPADFQGPDFSVSLLGACSPQSGRLRLSAAWLHRGLHVSRSDLHR
jgi:hypothetical protein